MVPIRGLLNQPFSCRSRYRGPPVACRVEKYYRVVSKYGDIAGGTTPDAPLLLWEFRPTARGIKESPLAGNAK